jgi:hypothetical protein
VLAHQLRPLRGVAERQHRDGLDLAVELADPGVGDAQFLGEGPDVHRRQVARSGQRDAVGADVVEQPDEGAHRSRGGLRGRGVGAGDVGDRRLQPRGVPAGADAPHEVVECRGQVDPAAGGARQRHVDLVPVEGVGA